jgi:hypothetical protein
MEEPIEFKPEYPRATPPELIRERELTESRHELLETIANLRREAQMYVDVLTERTATVRAVWNELDHAYFNDHYIDPMRGQGTSYTNDRGVRMSSLEAALGQRPPGGKRMDLEKQ